jgi:hypothetical protein
MYDGPSPKSVTEKPDAFTKGADYLDKGKDVIEKTTKLAGEEVNVPVVDELKAPVDLRDAVNDQKKALDHNDYVGATQATLDGSSAVSTMVGTGAEGLSTMGVGGAGAVGAAAAEATPVIAAAAGGFKAGTYLAKDVADNKDYAVDVDGNAKFGRKEDGSAKTRMDQVTSDAEAGNSAVGGGTLGKVVAINNAAVGGVVRGIESIPDALRSNPKALVAGQREGTAGTERMLQSKIDADNPMGPAPTPAQLRQALINKGVLPAGPADLETGHSYLPGQSPEEQKQVCQ